MVSTTSIAEFYTTNHNESAKFDARRLAYRLSILGSRWPVILLICTSLNEVLSNSQPLFIAIPVSLIFLFGK